MAYLAEGEHNLSPARGAWAAKHVDAGNRERIARDSDVFLHQALSSPCLSTVRRADGIWIEDVQGRRYMDFHGNNVHHIGYGHPELKDALKRQLDDLPFSPRRFTNDVAIELAEKLVAISPDPLAKVLLATGGSDAIEIALKVARAATGRFKTVSFWDSFHGAGFGGASVGGEAMFRSGPIGPLLAGSEHVPPFSCYRCPYGHEARDDGTPDLARCGMVCADMVRYVLQKEGDVAAVVAEPIRAVPYVPPPGFWPAVRQACDDHGALLIFDEVPSGLGKSGRMFTCEHYGVAPDILVTGKGLGGGVVPIAAVIARPELDVLGDFAVGHYTHEKNPFTARAALTTVEIIERHGLVENAASVGAHALDRLRDMQRRHRAIGDVRGVGLILGVDLVADRAGKAPDRAAAEGVLYRALERGLNFKITMGHVLTLTPPLIITRDEMDRALDILDRCIGEIETARAA